MPDEEDLDARDLVDPLAEVRDRFELPADLYLDGNSLGPVSDAAQASLESAFEEWRTLGVRAWTEADPPWFEYGTRLGAKLAPFVGAGPEECVVTGGTTVNIHSLIGAFLDATDGNTVLVDELDFPTDHYAIRAQLRARGHDPEKGLVSVESRDGRTIHHEDLIAQMEDHRPDVVFLPSVLYRSGQRLDVERLTRAAHDVGAVIGFDLAHSVGLIPHELGAHGVDFAVWCSYKYLNAGPGAIAGLYLNDDHFDLSPGLPGWWGNDDATQFELNPHYEPAPDASRFEISTVPVFSAAPLFGSLDVLDEAGIHAVHDQSQVLTARLIQGVDDELAEYGYAVGTPRAPGERGGHVAIEHDAAAAISAALRDQGVIVDYRPPNVVRVCPAPLYTSVDDVEAAIDALREVVATGRYTQYRDADDTVT